MEVTIRKMGNSQGVLIPKPILAQLGLEGTADLQVRDGVIEIRAIRRNPRAGWAEDAQRLAAEGAAQQKLDSEARSARGPVVSDSDA